MAQGMEIDDSFTFEIGLPNSFVNKPFKDFMQGLVSVSPYYQYTLEKGFAFLIFLSIELKPLAIVPEVQP